MNYKKSREVKTLLADFWEPTKINEYRLYCNARKKQTDLTYLGIREAEREEIEVEEPASSSCHIKTCDLN